MHVNYWTEFRLGTEERQHKYKVRKSHSFQSQTCVSKIAGWERLQFLSKGYSTFILISHLLRPSFPDEP